MSIRHPDASPSGSKVALDIPDRCDVVVIGGGPSGSTAAALLSKHGYEVVVLEKQEHPRDVVGESLIPHFWKYADLVGVSDEIDEARFVPKSGAVQTWNGSSRRMNFKPFGYDRPPLHVERAEFDHILLQNACRLGATLSERTRVTAVDFDADSVIVRYSHAEEREGRIEARYVIDASGQAAVVSRQEGTRVFDDSFRYMAMWAYFDGGSFTTYDGGLYPVNEWRKHPPVTYVSAIGDPGHSWLWHIVLKEKTSVGLILSREHVEETKRAGQTVKGLFFEVIRTTPIFGDLMASATYIDESFSAIRDYAYAAKDFVLHDRCFVVGDGAAFVDPINSVGVPFSMFTGYLASWCIHHRLQGSKTDVASFYRDQLANRISVYKLLALPPHLDDPPAEESERFLEALQQERPLEQELILVQSRLTNRPQRIRSLYEKAGLATTSDKISEWQQQW